MSAEVLCRAAESMRAQHGPDHERHAMWFAMADWLEGVAAWEDEGLGYTPSLNQTNWPSMWGDMQTGALVVARAYLGETP